MHDGILLLAKTFKELGLSYVQSEGFECALNASSWANGISITNFIRNVVAKRSEVCPKCVSFVELVAD